MNSIASMLSALGFVTCTLIKLVASKAKIFQLPCHCSSKTKVKAKKKRGKKKSGASPSSDDFLDSPDQPTCQTCDEPVPAAQDSPAAQRHTDSQQHSSNALAEPDTKAGNAQQQAELDSGGQHSSDSTPAESRTATSDDTYAVQAQAALASGAQSDDTARSSMSPPSDEPLRNCHESVHGQLAAAAATQQQQTETHTADISYAGSEISHPPASRNGSVPGLDRPHDWLDSSRPDAQASSDGLPQMHTTAGHGRQLGHVSGFPSAHPRQDWQVHGLLFLLQRICCRTSLLLTTALCMQVGIN